jgi:predicted Zn-dependent protease
VTRAAFRPILLLLIAWLVASGCVVQRSPISGKQRAYGYSWQQEKQIGQQADGEIVAQYGNYDDADLVAYVDSLGHLLLEVSHLRRDATPDEYRRTAFTFRVLDSPVVNAFALPGGYVYVTRGLLAHLNNEAQLAVVLGHEIGHVAGRHASQRALEMQLGQLGVLGGAILGQEVLGIPGGAVLDLGSQAAGLLFLKYGRDDERESDRLGVEYAALTGYRAGEGSGFFNSLERMTERSGQQIPSFLSSHPDPGEREQTIQRLAADWAARTPMEKVRESELMRRIDGIVYGDDPRQGFVEAGVFKHPTLRFRLPVPEGYHVINNAARVAMVAPGQDAVLLLSIDGSGETAVAAASDFRAQEGITVVSEGGRTVNGLPARFVVADATTSDGIVVRMIAQFVDYEANVYRLLAYAARTDFESKRTVLESVLSGFDRLRDPEALNRQPARVRVKRIETGGTFKALITNDLGTYSVQELAILNQLAEEDQIPTGQSLKTISN